MIYRYWCDECQNEYEIEPINEPVEEIKPKCCTMCKTPIDEWYRDEDEE
jgi:predicted nucleic acid-binding Zn ribbon protein